MLDSTNTTPCSGKDAIANSGFNGPYCTTNDLKQDGISFPMDTRYYDVYSYSTMAYSYNRRILGDATGEMGPFTDRTYGSQTRQVGSWYNAGSWFIFSERPWFGRGGSYNYGSETGIFSLGHGQGVGRGHFSFRLVLSV